MDHTLQPIITHFTNHPDQLVLLAGVFLLTTIITWLWARPHEDPTDYNHIRHHG